MYRTGVVKRPSLVRGQIDTGKIQIEIAVNDQPSICNGNKELWTRVDNVDKYPGQPRRHEEAWGG